MPDPADKAPLRDIDRALNKLRERHEALDEKDKNRTLADIVGLCKKPNPDFEKVGMVRGRDAVLKIDLILYSLAERLRELIDERRGRRKTRAKMAADPTLDWDQIKRDVVGFTRAQFAMIGIDVPVEKIAQAVSNPIGKTKVEWLVTSALRGILENS